VTTPHVEYLAHHTILLAVPAFLPAIAVVVVVLYVALRDRRTGGNRKVPASGAARPMTSAVDRPAIGAFRSSRSDR
jgi:hypothetical protein